MKECWVHQSGLGGLYALSGVPIGETWKMVKLLYPFSGGVWNTLGFHIRQYPACLESKMFGGLHDEVGLPHSLSSEVPPDPHLKSHLPHLTAQCKVKEKGQKSPSDPPQNVVISSKIKASLAN